MCAATMPVPMCWNCVYGKAESFHKKNTAIEKIAVFLRLYAQYSAPSSAMHSAVE